MFPEGTWLAGLGLILLGLNAVATPPRPQDERLRHHRGPHRPRGRDRPDASARSFRSFRSCSSSSVWDWSSGAATGRSKRLCRHVRTPHDGGAAMNVMTVIAHPNPKSFCHAILRQFDAGLERSRAHQRHRRPLCDPVRSRVQDPGLSPATSMRACPSTCWSRWT
ncbi:MAG: hypothetical protein MZW92_61565 [Comamonadaceae bacterium]|nr:hypothetical protein [Comamonadaceae bacterium]